jgi:hypothetical protein
MSKLTTEKFLLNKQGVRMFFFREDGLTPKQLEIMAKPVTKENRQDLEKTFDTSPSLGDNNGQPPNGGDKTNLAAPSPEDPNGPKSQEQTPVSGEKEQVEMRRTIEELRSQTTPSPEALKALQEAGITQKEARQEIGQEAATNMPKAKEARGIWSKMKQGLSDKWNNLGPNNTVRIAKLIAILALSGVTSVAGATLFLGISGTIAGAPLVTAGAIGSYTAIPFIGPALATSTPLFAGLATTAITAASAASVWGINKLFSKPKESKAGQAQQPQPEAQRNPETINENLEPKLIVALNIINNSPTPVSFNLDGQKYYIQFKNGQYLLTTPQQQDPRVLTEDVVKQSLSAQPEVVDQIVETGINKTQEYLNQVESTQNTSYLVFQLGDDKQLKVPVTFNQSPLEFSNTLNKLRELGLNINPSLLGSDETTSISSGFQPGKEYGQFIFKELETPQQAQQPEAEQQSPAVEEEKTPKARVDNALDTLATLPQNKATFEYKGRNITVENNEGNITVAVDDQPLDAKTFINALYKTPEAVEALEKAVQELQAQPSDSEQNPQNPEEPARTLDDLLAGNTASPESTSSASTSSPETIPTNKTETQESEASPEFIAQLKEIAILAGILTKNSSNEDTELAINEVTKTLAAGLGLETTSTFAGERSTQELQAEMQTLLQAGKEFKGKIPVGSKVGELMVQFGLPTNINEMGDEQRQAFYLMENIAKGKIAEEIRAIKTEANKIYGTKTPREEIMGYLELMSMPKGSNNSIPEEIKAILMDGEKMKKLMESSAKALASNEGKEVEQDPVAVLNLIDQQQKYLKEADQKNFQRALEATLDEIKETLGIQE